MSKNHLTDDQVKAILQVLEDTIKGGPWDTSNFLKVIGKTLQDYHNELTKLYNESNELKAKSNQLLGRETNPNQQEVFISLYTSDGSNIQAWERIILNLPRQMISRPIYANEEDVKNLIKSKENKLNEGYIAIFVDKNSILNLPPDKMPQDRFGKQLLTLRDRSLDLNNIHYFVHLSGTYRYQRGRLLMSNVER
ncbi:Dot/Icm secretion system protein IcmQ [Legionella gresilensis]|uniref:Dot/Icm secretion system protein IcmQ n=1 Tax=Legionella gresilensis TaxID=91823 RepID=UPI0010418BE0|nr:Dot/Icm secretion system protein IcmQ [Legionella gresilensis]